MSTSPRFLIVTAAFGEGHNSAARNLAIALKAAGADARVEDPLMLSTPELTKVVGSGYRYVTTHLPKVWARIYQSTDECDFSRPSLPMMRKPERCLGELIESDQPDAIISTFPLFPYFLDRIFAESGKRLPVFTVVTDSMEINASWLRAPTDYWLVTDAATKQTMVEKGLPAEKIIDLGFPVHPDFATLQPVPVDDPCDPFRILYFPTAKLPFVRRHSRALLDASPHVKLTIILGRNVRLLYSRAREIQQAYPGRVRLIGWTRKVPILLNKHHLVVGKAGGATVHEAIAARCPMLIHHLVPGQEEGNLRLLEDIGAGTLADSEALLATKVREMLLDNAAPWRAMKEALIRHDRNAGAISSAKFILTHIA